MNAALAELAAECHAELGEAPRWIRLDPSGTALHFSDLLTGTVYALRGDRAVPVLEFPGETVSALIPLEDGRSVIALHRSLAVIDHNGEVVERIPLDLPAGTRLSDATAGPSGHLWFGVVPAGDQPAAGMLVRLGDDGLSIQRTDIGFSNGLGFTADGTRMLHIDSATGTLWSIPHDPATGELGAPTALLVFPEAEGALDGLCLDELDRAWIAVFGGGEVLCVDTSGVIVSRVLVPALRASSCVFVDSTLYITTARVDAPEAELAEFTTSGSLFRYQADVAGGPVWEGHLS